MIQKNTLQSIISKYYLNGLVEAVKWEIKDKKLTIQFMSPEKDMLGKVEFKKIDLENVNIAIFNTTQLNKLLGITSGDLEVNIDKKGIIANKMNISDAQFDVSYSLADVNLIGKAASVDEPKKYQIVVDLDVEQINALIKAKNAIGIEDDNCNVVQSLSPDKESILSFIFGENTEHSNKVTYSVPIKQNVPGLQITFKSNYIKEILSANKELEKCTLSLYEEGLLKLSFSDKEGLNSEYFLIGK